MNDFSIVTLDWGKALLIPSNILIIALAVGVLLLWSRGKRLGLWLTSLTTALLLTIAVLPVASWVGNPLETRFPQAGQVPNSVAGIIVLGGAFKSNPTSDWDQPQLNSHAERLTAF